MNQFLNNPFLWALISMFTLVGACSVVGSRKIGSHPALGWIIIFDSNRGRKLGAGNWNEVCGLQEKGKGSYYSWDTNIGYHSLAADAKSRLDAQRKKTPRAPHQKDAVPLNHTPENSLTFCISRLYVADIFGFQATHCILARITLRR
jgi:hypothetical protein